MLPRIVNQLRPALVGLFAPRKIKLQSILSQITQEIPSPVLIIDVNHRWSSQNLQDNSIIIQPKSRYEFIEIIRELDDYVNPRLSLIIINDLPLYFRDFYGRDRLQTQNMRAYGACLALLLPVSRSIPIWYTSYPNGLDPSEPILFNHSKYYSDQIIRVKYNGNKIEFVDVETGNIGILS